MRTSVDQEAYLADLAKVDDAIRKGLAQGRGALDPNWKTKANELLKWALSKAEGKK